MCIICKEWQAGKLTSQEAFRAIGEFISSAEDMEEKKHLFELSDKILDKDLPSNVDSGLDDSWWKETHES